MATGHKEQGVTVNGTPNRGRSPRWFKVLNRPVVALQGLGLVFGPTQVISIPGRKSGKLRTTPVSPVTVDGALYIISVYGETDWVKNARAAGWAILSRGRKQERVALTELSLEERTSVLRELQRQVPLAVRFYRLRFGVENDPEAFAALAPRCPAFRIGGEPKS